MKQKDLDKKILISITGRKKKEWRDKIKEINKRKITRIAVFLSAFPKKERQGLYPALLDSCVKEIPLVHLRHDLDKEDIEFFIKNFKTKYFTIHEDYFNKLGKWRGFYEKLFLELDYNNKVAKNVVVKKIGGFCIDLSHFKLAEEKWTKEFEYTLKREGIKRYFKCNHLNGYDFKKNRHFHVVENLKQFGYLKTLPNFIFGDIMAIETWNTIEEQLKFKKKIIKILMDKI
jgi:hypothetical protein